MQKKDLKGSKESKKTPSFRNIDAPPLTLSFLLHEATLKVFHKVLSTLGKVSQDIFL